MENIKDLKLIIGPLDSTQWKEVTDWCDKNSIDSSKFSNTTSKNIYISFSFTYTDQGSYYSEESYPGYEKITYQQWYDRFIKKDVKQNKEEIMNNKQNFSISGTTVLKKAFVEEVGLPTFSSQSIDSNLTSCIIAGKPALQGDSRVVSSNKILFNLPQDWTKALEYVKEYFKEEPKFKVGDYIYFINRIESVSPEGSIGKITNISKGSKPWINYSTKLGTGAFEIESYTNKGSFRLATSDEILDVLVKESGFKVGDNIISTDKEYHIKGIIKKFYVDTYITKDTDDKFLYVTLEDGQSYVTTNFYGVPQFELCKSSKTLVVGDKRIKVEISKGEIWAESKRLSIELVDEAIGAMTGEELDWGYNDTSWAITFPEIKLGCTTLSLDEVKLIKKTYEELND